MPAWSRDGRWIYFASNRGGRLETWKMPPAGGVPVRVTLHGGGPAFESGDGEYLYYLKTTLVGIAGPAPLFRMPRVGGPEQQILPRMGGPLMFDVNRTALYFSPDGKAIQRLEFASGNINTVASADKPIGGGLCASPDDAYLVWSQYDRYGAELMLVEGFQ